MTSSAPRARTHGQALRVLSNRLVGILHGCLASLTAYDEVIAWRRYEERQPPLDIFDAGMSTRMCELLIGLPAVVVLGIVDEGVGTALRVHVEMRSGRRPCGGCGASSRVKERLAVTLVELHAFVRQTRLVWRKHRLCLP